MFTRRTSPSVQTCKIFEKRRDVPLRTVTGVTSNAKCLLTSLALLFYSLGRIRRSPRFYPSRDSRGPSNRAPAMKTIPLLKT